MSVLSKLTFANLKQNKRRTFFTVLGVTLAAALMLAVVGMATSLQQTLINATIEANGNYHVEFSNVAPENLKYIENNAYVESYYLSNDAPENSADIFVRFKHAADYEKATDNIIGTLAEKGDDAVERSYNMQLIQYEGGLSEAAMQELIAVAAIVVAIIMITSIFAIKNSFSISATERTRQFGMLRSVGATKSQIRRSVILEGLMVWLVGAPCGILLGLLATVILAQIVTALIGESLSVPFALAIPFWIFPTIFILSFITVYFSALFPAVRAAKITPVEAIRSSQEIKINPRKVRVSPLTREFFGIGGVIASKNLKRSRKKYRTTVLSIVISVATFIGLSTFMDQAFGTAKVFYRQVEYDMMVVAEDEKVITEIAENFNLEKSAYYYDVQTDYEPADNIYLVAEDDESFAKYAESVGVKDKNLDDLIILSGDLESSILEGAFKTTVRPLGHELNMTPVAFVSFGYVKKHGLETFENVRLYAKTPDAEAIKNFVAQNSETDETHRSVQAENIRASMQVLDNMYLLIAICLYGFIAVITLIGVTNIFNTISANVALRARDFASLKSIGMTTKEFNHMIRLESLMYSVKALAVGIPIGLLISYGFYKAMSATYDFGYTFPLGAIVMAVIAVAVLIWAIMRYSVNLVNKQNIIETIRSDTV